MRGLLAVVGRPAHGAGQSFGHASALAAPAPVELRMYTPAEAGEEAKALAGSARANLGSFAEVRARDAELGGAMRGWSTAPQPPGSAGAPELPTPAFQLLLADEVSRTQLLGEVAVPAVRERLAAELAARAEAAVEVLREGLPHAPRLLRKKLLAAVQALRLPDAPKPPAFARVEGEPDDFGAKTVAKPVSLSNERVFGLILRMAAAFWPEFDWTFTGDFRHQLGEMAGAGSLAASLSAELYRKAFTAIAKGADAARHAPASERLQGRSLVSAAKVKEIVQWAKQERVAALRGDERVAIQCAHLEASLAAAGKGQPGGPIVAAGGAGGAHISPAGARVLDLNLNNATRVSFRQRFGKCMFYNVTGSCKSSACSDAHELVQEAALLQWAATLGGRAASS